MSTTCKIKTKHKEEQNNHRDAKKQTKLWSARNAKHKETQKDQKDTQSQNKHKK